MCLDFDVSSIKLCFINKENKERKDIGKQRTRGGLKSMFEIFVISSKARNINVY